MVTVTIDISDADKQYVKNLISEIVRNHGWSRLASTKQLIDWIFEKHRKGLKVIQVDPNALHKDDPKIQVGPEIWHVFVPR